MNKPPAEIWQDILPGQRFQSEHRICPGQGVLEPGIRHGSRFFFKRNEAGAVNYEPLQIICELFGYNQVK